MAVARTTRGASMRPGLLCPGKPPCLRLPLAAVHASMRPGLLCPGKEAAPEALRRIAPGASMRPGLLCPGKPAALGPDPTPLFGFNEAGAVMPRKGHIGIGCQSSLWSFNEAGAVMPRKAREDQPPSGGVVDASMRPGLLCPGKAGGDQKSAQRVAASMRPGLLCPGKRQLRLSGSPK